MVKIKSLLACVIVINNIRIVPQNNEISDEDFEKLKKHNDYKLLVNDEKLIVIVPEEEDTDNTGDNTSEGVNITKMKNAELWTYAESQGIEIPSNAKRADVLKLIQLLSESDD